MLSLKVIHQTILEPNNLTKEKTSSEFATLLGALQFELTPTQQMGLPGD